MGVFGRKAKSIEIGDRNVEIERLLIEGELITDDDGKEVRVYPQGQDIAKRMGVSRAWVSKYASTNKCFERRAAMQGAIKMKAREKLAQLEASRVAFELDEQLALCDKLLTKYAEAIEQRGIGNVTAHDVAQIVRLRHFIKGDADSRIETQQQTVTLEMMQEAHANLFRGEEKAGENADAETSGRPGDAAPQPSDQDGFCHQLAEIGRGLAATR